MWIPRVIEALLRQCAATRPVVVLAGARQTGKTSLMRRLFPDHEFVSLDFPGEAEQAERDPQAFLRRHPPPVILDEAQNAPGLFGMLKVAVDRDRDRAGGFLLTGSQPLRLMAPVARSLAGRASIVELEPLSFGEAKAARPDLTPSTFLVRGGFPELYRTPGIDSAEFLRSYVTTYLERDLRQVLQVGSLRDFQRFFRVVALRSGNLLNRSDVARDVGIAGSTAGAWLSALEASHQAVLVEPWFSNRKKSLARRPKLYLRETGIAAFLCGIASDDELERSPFAGPLWETLVASEIRRTQLARRGGWDFFVYRDRSREADFLFHRGGFFALADAKWSERPRTRDAAGLRRVANQLPEGAVRAMTIVCRASAPHPLAGSGVHAVPLEAIGNAPPDDPRFG